MACQCLHHACSSAGWYDISSAHAPYGTVQARAHMVSPIKLVATVGAFLPSLPCFTLVAIVSLSQPRQQGELLQSSMDPRRRAYFRLWLQLLIVTRGLVAIGLSKSILNVYEVVYKRWRGGGRGGKGRDERLEGRWRRVS